VELPGGKLFLRRERSKGATVGKGGTIMKGLPNENRIDTTLGDLIEAVSEAVFETCDNSQEGYAVAGLVLAEILRSRFPTYTGDECGHGRPGMISIH
jgi:hypothetical protein